MHVPVGQAPSPYFGAFGASGADGVPLKQAVWYNGRMTAPTTAPAPRVSNQELGELIGLSHSSVSRLRSGERGTSVQVMLKVEQLLAWDLHDQIKQRDEGKYAEKLERLLSEWKKRRDLRAS